MSFVIKLLKTVSVWIENFEIKHFFQEMFDCPLYRKEKNLESKNKYFRERRYVARNS